MSAEDGPVIWFNQIGFMVSALVLSYVPCHYGEKLTTKSSTVLTASYELYTMGQSKKFYKMILIFMSNIQETMKIGASQYYRLSLEQFMEVTI